MHAHERILEGVEAAVERHWRFTKNLLQVKPEYLFTVSIADALTKGFDGIDGLDLIIKLEEQTHKVTAGLVINASGFNALLSKVKTFFAVDRKGRVDIYVEREVPSPRDSWIVEVKGFDPAWNLVRDDILRLCQFLLRSGDAHRCRQCEVPPANSTESE